MKCSNSKTLFIRQSLLHRCISGCFQHKRTRARTQQQVKIIKILDQRKLSIGSEVDESKLLKLKTSCTVRLPPTVSVLCLDGVGRVDA